MFMINYAQSLFKRGCHPQVLPFPLILSSYDRSIDAEGLLPAELCLVTLLSSNNVRNLTQITPVTHSNGKENIHFQNKMY